MFKPNLAIHSAPHFPIWSNEVPMIGRNLNGEIHRYANNPNGFSDDPMFADHTTFNTAFILHCFFKSSIEWLWKTSRTRGDQPLSTELNGMFSHDHWFANFMLQYNKPAEPIPETYNIPSEFHENLDYLKKLEGVGEIEVVIKNNFSRRLSEIINYVRSSDDSDNLGTNTRDFFSILSNGSFWN